MDTQITTVAWTFLDHLSTSPDWHFNSSLKFLRHKKQLRSDERIVFDLSLHLTVEFPQGREAHHPILFSPSSPHTHTPPVRTPIHAYTQSRNSRQNSPHLLLPHSLVSPLQFSRCAAKARLPPPVSHNYLLTAQTNRATHRVTSNQNCHRWLSLVIKSARPLPVRRVREWKQEGECDSSFIIDPK